MRVTAPMKCGVNISILGCRMETGGEKNIRAQYDYERQCFDKILIPKIQSQRQENVYIVSKREEARLLNDLSCNKTITKSNIKMEEIKDLWLNSKKGIEYANTTSRGYIWYFDSYIKPVFGGKSVSDIKPIHIQSFVDAMSEKYSAETVNKNINILANIFNHAFKKLKIINESPVAGIERLKVDLEDAVTWTYERIYEFLSYDKVINSNYYELILTSFLLGTRPSEVCGLYVKVLDCNGVLLFDRGFDSHGEITDLKTKKSHRVIKLSKDLHMILLNRIDKQKQQERKKGEKYIHSPFLFKQPNGKPINSNSYSTAFKKLLRAYNGENMGKELSLPDICLYGARHSFETNAITKNNANINLVVSVMGNSPRVLISRYVHPDSEVHGIVVSDNQNKIFKSNKDD